MFGGLLKSTSLAALVAVAGVALSGVSAQAADLGGNCCADLEERIAELEATTARKGNRKVSLTVSGQVNQSVLFFDDGVEKNAYVTDNEASRTRVRFLGSAKIDASWSAGYLLELGVRGNRQDTLSANGVVSGGVQVAGASNGVGSKVVDVRHSVWWLQNKDLGKVWMGQTSDAIDGITEINLANTGHFASPQLADYVNGFQLRNPNGTTGLQFSGVWNGSRSGANPGEGDRFNVVKYDTPTIAGFIASVAWGEDDIWTVGLRYAGEFSGFKMAAGIGYMETTDGFAVSTSTNLPQNGARGCARIIGATGTGSDVSCNELGLSGSLMHTATGLYGFGAYGRKVDDNRKLLTNAAGTVAQPLRKDDHFYYVQGGIEQKFFPVGKSTFFGEYYSGDFAAPNTTPVPGVTGSSTGRSAAAGAAFTGSSGYVTNSTVEMWGIGFNQNVEAAAMDFYVGYRNYSVEVRDSAGAKSLYNDVQTVTTGARIQF